jgi:hypothetical protein
MSTVALTLLIAMVSMPPKLDNAVFTAGELTCVIGDNAAQGKHGEGYNGVFSITSPALTRSPFVETYAGLNLEHYFDARVRPEDRKVFFEPRNQPMLLKRLKENLAELYQPATPVFGVESWTRFELSAPNYVDMHFRCVPRKEVFQGGFFGVFWASYIDAPENKSIHFLEAGSTLDAPKWVEFCTAKHGTASSVLHESDTLALPFAVPEELLYANIAPVRYSVPFFYGRVRDHVLIYIFKPGPVVRFAHSPSGGGNGNPAWDFQLIVPKYEINKEYLLDMRLVCKPWVDEADVLKEVRKYLAK